MITGRPVFEGRDQSQVLNQIAAILGPPTSQALSSMNVSKIDVKLNFNPQHTIGDWSKVFKRKVDPLALDFVSKLVVWDPNERVTPLKALLHPFFDELFVLNSASEDNN